MPKEKEGFTYFRHISGAGVVELQQKVFRLCSKITYLKFVKLRLAKNPTIMKYFLL